jgi:hypothetical protein
MDAGNPRMPTDDGGVQMPTADAASDDAAQSWDAGMYTNSTDAGAVLDASTITAPPTPVDAGGPLPLLDAGNVTMDAGSSVPEMDAAASGDTDAAVDAGAAAPDAGTDAGVPARVCATGKQLGGHCWFFANTNQSCNAFCAAHGGYEPSLEWVGTPAQGGSLAHCDAVLELLRASSTTTTSGYREDGRGLGCHLYQGQSWWLVAPAFSPASSYLNTRIACSCVDQ